MPRFGENIDDEVNDNDGDDRYSLHENIHTDSCDLAFSWKRKVRLKRAVDALCSPRDELGLRLSKETSLPSLTDLVSGVQERGEY